MSASHKSVCFMACLLAAAVGAIAVGQDAPKGKAGNKGNEKHDHKLDGTIEGLQRGMLLVKSEQKNWYVMMVPPSRKKENGNVVEEPGTEVSVTGTTTADSLQPGAYVEFSATIDGKKLAATEPVKSVKIVSPHAGFHPGVNSEAAPADESTDDGKKKSSKAAAIPDGPANIAGHITAVKNGKIQVNTGGKKPVTMEVAEDAEIAIDATSVAFCHKGDTISVDGWYTKEGQLYAKKITVTMSAANAPVATKKKPGKVAKKPADEKGADEKSANEKGVDEKAAEEKPTAEKPADKKPSAEKKADANKADEKKVVGSSNRRNSKKDRHAT